MRYSLDKLQQEHEACLTRNSAVPKGKNVEAEEAMNAVSLSKISFRSAALDIVQKITILQEKKRFEILDNVSVDQHCCYSLCLQFFK